MGVYGWVPVRESLCLFWRETHTKGLCARSPTRPEGHGKEGPRDQSTGEVSQQKDAVSRREQKKPVDKTGQSGDESRAEKETSQQKSKRWLLVPADLQMLG